MSKIERRYKESPKLERDEESGSMAVKKPAKSEGDHKDMADKAAGGESAGIPAHARHNIERMAVHQKHQMEHHAHDHSKAGDKKEIHARHEAEIKAMHKRHEGEIATGGEAIAKVKEDKKA